VTVQGLIEVGNVLVDPKAVAAETFDRIQVSAGRIVVADPLGPEWAGLGAAIRVFKPVKVFGTVVTRIDGIGKTIAVRIIGGAVALTVTSMNMLGPNDCDPCLRVHCVRYTPGEVGAVIPIVKRLIAAGG